MNRDLLNQTLDRAFTALEHISQDEIRQLSLLDCAFTLEVLPADDQLADIKMRLAERLQRQLSSSWIHKGDLLEVFAALVALWIYDPTRVSGDQLTGAIQRLVQCEAEVGGPYYSNDTIQVAANLQIASFVRLVAKPLPGLDTFLGRVIAAGHFKNTELDSPYILYSFAKLYDYPKVRHYIASNCSRTPGYQAVALAVANHRAPLLQQKLLAVCRSQQATGFWPGETLLGGIPGSPVTSTALIVKLLVNYRTDSIKPSLDLQQRHQSVAQTARQLFDTNAEPLRRSTLQAIDKVCGIEKAFEITLLSYFFAQALKHPINLTDRQFAMLGAASVCGWVAYTIYDDFLDGEGVSAQLPIANVTMRASLDCFRAALPKNPAFERYVASVFNEMDEANAWEINNCRFAIHDATIVIAQLPKYGRQTVLAARSFAHALGPIAILNQYTQSTLRQTRSIESAFRHYLIARQLSDDLHDWLDDMRTGQASFVVIAILRDMHLQRGSYDLSALLTDMQKRFRRTTMPHVCILALRHITKAKQDFIKSELLHTTNNIYTLLDELELSLRHSLDQHSKAQALVAAQVSYSV